MTWFNSWNSMVRVSVTAVTAYAALIFCLRLSGKRTLSKLNAFDLVVTVALGSTLATVILSKDVALVVDEVLAAIRGQGVEGLTDLRAVVLETDGSLSVVWARGARPLDAVLSSVTQSSGSLG